MLITKKNSSTNQETQDLIYTLEKFYETKVSKAEIYHLVLVDQEVDLSFLVTEDEEVVSSLPDSAFVVMDHDGQYNQKQDMIKKQLKTLFNQEVNVKVAKAYDIELQSNQELVKSYLINPVVQKEVKLDEINFDFYQSDDKAHQPVDGFIQFNDSELEEMTHHYGLDFDDLKFIQDYFKQENRDPRISELKLLEAYWSDHCRHTTFLTQLDNIEVIEGPLHDTITKTLNDYYAVREEVYTDKVKPVTLMDLATINARQLKKQGKVTDIEETDEVNACSVEVDIMVDGQPEKWLHMFKNETHNHPTEIEPYGGAHTCIGGAIRDPLSGRSAVIGGIRIVGAGSPLEPVSETLENKLPQAYLSKMAKQGFSDYANQIGASVGLVKEYYDEGFKAKRMELGALVAAVKKDHVTRAKPQVGDVIYLLGAPTGRDGLGAAVGSSSVQTEQSLTKAGAEVQKGNPFEERKIMRLFKNPKASKLIKKSNDFGAGGVSVAIGELADGLLIDLNQVPTKYPGMNGYEIALSESQERMAVVLDPHDVEEFLAYCDQEDVLYSKVADVTDSNRLQMTFNNELIIDLDRKLLDSAGAPKSAQVAIDTSIYTIYENDEELNQSISPSLSQGFDSTVDRNRVLMEYGGQTQRTQQRGIVTKFPVENTDAVSVMTYGYTPQLGKSAPFLGGYVATLQAITANVAMTGDLSSIRLSMQEFFPSIKGDPKRFGKPVASLLGAFKVMKGLDIPAIGGKDSMSGTFNEIDVPETLVCFAVNTSTIDRVVSREFKQENSLVVISTVRECCRHLIDLDHYQEMVKAYQKLHENHQILSASDVSEYGLEFTLKQMGAGNNLVVEGDELTGLKPGQIVFEVSEETFINKNVFKVIGRTKKGEVSVNETLKAAYPGLDFIASTAQFEAQPEEVSIQSLDNKALILVLEGSTSEDETKLALEKEGFDVKQAIIKTNSNQDYLQSLDVIREQLIDVSLLVCPHGDYVGIKLSRVLTDLHNEIKYFRQNKGLVLGIGAGFGALVEAGYFGQHCRFVSNPYQRYVHSFVECEVIKDSNLGEAGECYTSIVSGDRLVLEVDDFESLQNDSIILAQQKEQLTESDCPIEMICTKDQTVLGIRSLVVRLSEDLYKNIPVSGYPTVLRNLFKGRIK